MCTSLVVFKSDDAVKKVIYFLMSRRPKLLTD